MRFRQKSLKFVGLAQITEPICPDKELKQRYCPYCLHLWLFSFLLAAKPKATTRKSMPPPKKARSSSPPSPALPSLYSQRLQPDAADFSHARGRASIHLVINISFFDKSISIGARVPQCRGLQSAFQNSAKR